MFTAMTSLSSKGQVVIPKELRATLSLKEGSKFFIMSDGDSIMLKRIKEPDEKEFWSMMKKEREWAKSVGMKKSDIGDAIRAVRASHK